jgi:hypothetical protein
MKLDVKMSRGALLLREKRRRDPPCMYYKCHSKGGGSTQGGRTIEKGGTLHERGLGI